MTKLFWLEITETIIRLKGKMSHMTIRVRV